MSMDPPATVYRSQRRRACEERQLVLFAVAIAAEVVPACGEFLLQVEARDAPEALRQLARYEAENRAPPPPPPPPPLHPHAWVGCLLYAATLIGVAAAISAGVVRLDAFDLGALDCARVQAGQWWRAWTALTLHLDAPHLTANLGAGIWFGWLAARQIGAGLAWFLTVTGGALANLVEGLSGPPEHGAVGASTAVFAALGALSAFSWRVRWHVRERWVRRWGPLVAGVVLLGWTGSSGAGTDLIGHVAGFIAGVLLGAAAASARLRPLIERVPQWLTGALALAQVLAAWCWALLS